MRVSPDDSVTLDETLRYLSSCLNRPLARRAVRHWRHGKNRRSTYAVDGVLHILAASVPRDYLNRLANEFNRYRWRGNTMQQPRAVMEFPLDEMLMLASEPTMGPDQRYAALVTFARLQGMHVQ